MFIVNKEFMVLDITENETKKGKKKTKYLKFVCKDLEAPAFTHDYYYVLDYNNNLSIEINKKYNMTMYLNSSKGNLFLVLISFFPIKD